MNNSSSPSTQSFTLEEVLSQPRVAMVSAFLLLLTVFILIGNFLVLWTIYSTRRLRFSAFYFVASLGVSDLLVGVLVLPISLAYHLTHEMRGQWIFGTFTCQAWLLANFWFCSASVLNLCLVSWDRYVAVTSSLRYQVRMSDNRVLRMIALSWGISLCIAVVLVAGSEPKSGEKPNCNVINSHKVVTLLGSVFVFIIPVFLLVFVNGRIWMVARGHIKRIHVNVQEPGRSGTDKPSARSLTVEKPSKSQQSALELSVHTLPTVKNKERKAVSLSRTLKLEIKTFKTFVVVIGVFVVCWTPFYIMLVTSYFGPIHGLFFYFTIVLTYSNSAINVLIYAIFCRDFRKALIESIKCTKRRDYCCFCITRNYKL